MKFTSPPGPGRASNNKDKWREQRETPSYNFSQILEEDDGTDLFSVDFLPRSLHQQKINVW